MYELQYSKPSSVNDAVSEIKKSSDAKFLAGGMTLIPTLKADYPLLIHWLILRVLT